MSKWHSMTIEEIFKELNTSKDGLKEDEYLQKLKKYGKNKIEGRNEFLDVLIEEFKNKFLLMFVFAAVLSFIFKGFYEGIFILSFVFIYILFDLYQQYRSIKVIKSLEKSLEKKCLVIRNGKKVIVNSEDLVPGDIIILRYGEKVPADIRIIESEDLLVDESSLTGESEPVHKYNTVLPENVPISNMSNMLFSNTFILKGYCLGVVVETGLNTYFGKLYKKLKEEKLEKTDLQKEIDKFAGTVSIIISISILFIFIATILKHTFTIIDAIIFSIALTLLMIPEGLPIALILIYTLSLDKLRKKNVFVKSPKVMEDIGHVEVILSDKTGTLTHNSLVVSGFYYNGLLYTIKDNQVLRENFFVDKKEYINFLEYIYNTLDKVNLLEGHFFDPVDKAIYNISSNEQLNLHEKINVRYFDPFKKSSSVIIKKDNKYVLIQRGALRSVLNSCSYIFINNKIEKIEIYKDHILNLNEKLSKSGYKIIAFAYKESFDIDKDEKNLIFLGFLILEDPIRENLKESYEKIKELDVDFYILSGDDPFVCQFVANKVGMNTEFLMGEEIKKMSDEELYAKLQKVKIIARADPYDKYRVVNLFKKYGKKVMFIGDGMNDAISLKSAHVGVSLFSATDIAKESANVILMDNSLSAVLHLIEEGKRVIFVLKTYLLVMVSAMFGAFILVTINYFIYDSITFTAIQILILNLVIETLTSLLVGEGKIMDEKVLKEKFVRIIDKNFVFELLRNSIFIGITSLTVSLATNYDSFSTMLFLMTSQYVLYIYYQKKYKIDFTSSKNYYISLIIAVIILLIFTLPALNALSKLSLPTLFNLGIYIIETIYFYIILMILYKVEKSAVSEHHH